MSGIVGSNLGRGSGLVKSGGIANDAVGLAEMASGTDGNIISYDGSGNPTAVATGNDGQVLTSAGAGAICAFEDAGGGVALTGSTNNTVVTVTGSDAIQGEATLKFDGTHLTVDGATHASVKIDRGSTSDDGGLFFETGGVTKFRLGMMDADTKLAVYDNVNGYDIWRANAEGAITKPKQPAFHAYNGSSQTNLTADSSFIVNIDTEVFDQGGDFNTGTYIFTAPITGRYLLTYHLTLNNVDNATTFIYAHLDTSNREYYHWYDPNTELNSDATYVTFPVIVVADMDASDTARMGGFIGAGGGTEDTATATNTWFSGCLLA